MPSLPPAARSHCSGVGSDFEAHVAYAWASADDTWTRLSARVAQTNLGLLAARAVSGFAGDVGHDADCQQLATILVLPHSGRFVVHVSVVSDLRLTRQPDSRHAGSLTASAIGCVRFLPWVSLWT
jgi:hypothetical protein